LHATAQGRAWFSLILFVGFLALSSSDAETGELKPRPFSWNKLSTFGESGLTFESACAYDRGVRRLVMFGGHGHDYAGVERNDTWLFDPEQEIWSEASPANRPPGACNTRDLIYSPAMKASVYFGGCNYFHGWQLVAEKIRGGAPPWVFDAVNETWKAMKPTGETPPRVAYAGMAYDSHNQVIVKFGGGGCKSLDDGGTWVYDGYVNEWTRMNPTLSPGTGRLPAMVYDASNRRILLTGADDGRGDELWAYDIRKDQWKPLDPGSRPPAGEMFNRNWGGPVDYGIFIYDERNEVPLLFRPYRGYLGTWAFNGSENTWIALSTFRSPPGAALVQAAYVPEFGQTFFVNGATPGGFHFLEGTWSFTHPEPPDPVRPARPENLNISSTRKSVKLSWDRGNTDRKGTWAVYRGQGRRPWEVTYSRIAETSSDSYTDKSSGQGIHFYYVTKLDSSGLESRESTKVRTQPTVLGEPWVWATSDTNVEIRWDPSEGKDVTGYNVYRGNGRPGFVDKILTDGHAETFVRINNQLVRGAGFQDTPENIDEAAYLIRAVNVRGEESGASPWTLAIPSEVKGIFLSRAGADGSGGVEVIWTAGREESLKGYNVYRMDSADHRKGIKLNMAPVSPTRYLDKKKTDDLPARYYVAAVDNRGVEGLMSFGAWINDDKRN
jgi:fibronectin type 3 domain-containing protein